MDLPDGSTQPKPELGGTLIIIWLLWLLVPAFLSGRLKPWEERGGAPSPAASHGELGLQPRLTAVLIISCPGAETANSPQASAQAGTSSCSHESSHHASRCLFVFSNPITALKGRYNYSLSCKTIMKAGGEGTCPGEQLDPVRMKSKRRSPRPTRLSATWLPAPPGPHSSTLHRTQLLLTKRGLLSGEP